MEDCPYCQNQRVLEGFDWVTNLPVTHKCSYCSGVRIMALEEVERARRRYQLATKEAVKAIIEFRRKIEKTKKRNVKR